MEALEESKMRFARRLASSNKRTREKAISLLVLWLTSQKQVKEDELKKIWKGLFYCVWHSDKLPVQADLIERLASLTEKLDIALSLQFFRVFLSTMRREWAGIDRLRLDKFYLLLRKYLIHMFAVLESSGWDTNLTKEFMDLLLERTFLAKDQYAALGINLHYADIFIPELEKLLPLRDDTCRLLLEPFLVVMANASDKSLLQRVRENVFGHLLDYGHTVILAKQEGNALDSIVESLGSMVLSLSLGPEVFRLASLPSTSQANRKGLYELHEEFEKLEKLLNTSSVSISLDSVGRKKKKNKELGHSSLLLEDDNSLGKKLQEGKAKRSKRKVPEGGQTNLAGSQSKEQEASGGDTDLNNKKAKKKSKEKSRDMVSIERKRTGVKQELTFVAEGSQLGLLSDANGLSTSDPVVSNLKEQFDSLAAEGTFEADLCQSPVPATINDAVSPRNTGSRNRKRVMNITTVIGSERVGKRKSISPKLDGRDMTGGLNSGYSSGKVKRVRFSLKNNVVWKPHSPLPPENVRVPPSATPRGSALKKGVLPGPIFSAEEISVVKQRKGTPRRPLAQTKMKKKRRSLLNQ